MLMHTFLKVKLLWIYMYLDVRLLPNATFITEANGLFLLLSCQRPISDVFFSLGHYFIMET